MSPPRELNYQILLSIRGGGKESIEFATAEKCFSTMVRLKALLAIPAATREGVMVFDTMTQQILTPEGMTDVPTIVIENQAIVTAKMFITKHVPPEDRE